MERFYFKEIKNSLFLFLSLGFLLRGSLGFEDNASTNQGQLGKVLPVVGLDQTPPQFCQSTSCTTMFIGRDIVHLIGLSLCLRLLGHQYKSFLILWEINSNSFTLNESSKTEGTPVGQVVGFNGEGLFNISHFLDECVVVSYNEPVQMWRWRHRKAV